MDRHFLKFWGNFLLQAAEGQKRVEDLSRWMNSGFSLPGDLTEMFTEAYGLKPKPASGSKLPRDWEKASEQFQQAFSEYLDLFGAVPRSRHEALRKKKERLEKTVEEQARTIVELKTALAQSRMQSGDVLSGFQQLIDVQNEQFRQVSENLNRFLLPFNPD